MCFLLPIILIHIHAPRANRAPIIKPINSASCFIQTPLCLQECLRCYLILVPFITSTTCLCPCLQLQLVQNGLRHVLVLPRATIHLLELDAVQAQQRYLDHKDLKLENHAFAQVTLHVC